LAAKIAEKKFGVRDKDILNAISYHTTGRKDMSQLEKIIYLADCIEPNRTYDDTDIVRELTYKNLDEALRYKLNIIIEQNKRRKRLVHPFSIEAVKFYKK
jgi:nicotinate-nucleotide adenylyltransferase